MNYTVVVTEQAAREIEEAAAWWASERSAEQAQRWYGGIRQAVAGLGASPERCPITPERDEFPYEIRESYYVLRSKPTHRIVFTILSKTVLVLSVRHVSRGPLRPADLG
jgi:plasmid stabilization system protein ParE